jgi:hypothetical protein
MAWNRADVLKALGEVEVENLQHVSGLHVVGLKWPSPIGVDYMTLDEAVLEEMLDVSGAEDVNRGDLAVQRGK